MAAAGWDTGWDQSGGQECVQPLLPLALPHIVNACVSGALFRGCALWSQNQLNPPSGALALQGPKH
jgi:hypothetical protein